MQAETQAFKKRPDGRSISAVERKLVGFSEEKPGELKPQEYQALKCLFAHSPKQKLAYDLCEHLIEIFERSLSKSDAQQKIRNWIKRVKLSNNEVLQ